MEKVRKTVKPSMVDCYGNKLAEMTKERLSEVLQALQLEKSRSCFWKEGVRFQRKHNATIDFVQSLLNQ